MVSQCEIGSVTQLSWGTGGYKTLSGKVMKIKCNFKKTVTSELEKCAEKCREEIVHIEKKTLTAGR